MRWLFAFSTAAILFAPCASRSPAAEPAARLTPRDLDALLVKELKGGLSPDLVSDEQFLRRASLDLIGRPPTPDEREAFLKGAGPDQRAKAIDRLLASAEFGRNWANYWSDTISYRVPPPELTFLNYTAFKGWLAGKLNEGAPWDEVVRALLAATGPVKDNPAATFVGYHRGHAAKLAAETARIFQGVQLQCAECHDHKFDHWKRAQFHQLAAYFARTAGDLGKVQDGSSTVVKDRGKGEYEMPDALDPRKKGTVMTPTFLTGEAFKLGAGDAERRAELARLVTRPENPYFTAAYVNRVWARLMGRGFYEPVDNMADYQRHELSAVHRALAAHFTATKCDVKDLFRLVMNTRAYQQPAPLRTGRLRGDEVFDALAVAVGLPNVTPPARKATPEERFPPPPKSTRDLVNAKFGHDPSLCPEDVARTMGQALLLMNNEQLHKQINADPESGTPLSKLLRAEADDDQVIRRLFRQVLGREPTVKEVSISREHLRRVGKREVGFEDIVWSLVNSAEFTTKR